jgi:primosomal protein N' (replication factor Y)
MCNHEEKSVISVILDDALDKLLEYSVPQELKDSIFLGSRVLVPVKNTFRQATVWEIKSHSEYQKLKPIAKVLSKGSVTTKDVLDLAKWMAKYYCTPLHKVLTTILPSSIRQSTKEKDQYFIIKNLSKEEIAKHCSMLRLSDPKQAKVLDIVLYSPAKILLSDLLMQANVSRSPVETLVKKKILTLEKGTIDRSSVVWEQEYFIGKPKSLNQEQQLALEKIQHSLNENTFTTHLLFGVTGSGKTEVYLQAIEHALSQKKGIIFLIPEIILTSQTIERLKSRFKEKIALLHHRLSQGERHDTWQNILSGAAPIVIGARSALFSPTPNLGLIIVDEEHESSYKQTEESPCYHARDVAIVRAKLCQATIILGSATPSLESFENTLKGKYILSSLTSRPGHFTLPEVSVVDMKHEYDKKKGFTLFSDKLLSALKSRLAVGEQSLLLLNRRGYHSSQICLQCAHIMKCPHCDMNLTFHLGENILACHLCDFRQKNEKCCPNCQSEGQMKFKGAGTELVEKSLHAIFPEARVLRMDADTTKKKGSHEDLCRKFKSGKADILIGTQMIAKGLHFPLVTLVGVLNADVNLQIPDFRASEHVFQLLTQVAGRSGRSDLKGEVVIQTMIPDNSILVHSSKQDFMGFYHEEIEIRKLFQYPPFVHLVKCTIVGASQELTLQKAQWARSWLTKLLPQQVELLPVTPCGRAKIQDQFRYQFLLKMEKMILIHDKMMMLSQNLAKDKLKLYVDVDPLSTYF